MNMKKRGLLVAFVMVLFVISLIPLLVFGMSKDDGGVKPFGIFSQTVNVIPNSTYEFKITEFNLSIFNKEDNVFNSSICKITLWAYNYTVVNSSSEWNTTYNGNTITWEIYNESDCIHVGENKTFTFLARGSEVNIDTQNEWQIGSWNLSGNPQGSGLKYITTLNDNLAPRLIDWSGKDEGLFVKNNDTIPFSFFISYIENESGIDNQSSELKYDYEDGCVWTESNHHLNLSCNGTHCTTEEIFNNDTANYIGFSFNLSDLAGNINSTEYFNGTSWTSTKNLDFIYLDNKMPSVNLTGPKNQNITNSSIITFSFNISDDSFSANNGAGCSGIFNPQLYCNLTLTNTLTNNVIIYNQTITSQGAHNFTENLLDGVYNWSILCQDKAGWVNQSEYRLLTVDTTPPNISLIAPDNGSYQTTNVTFTWDANDNIDNELNCTLNVNGNITNVSGYGHINYVKSLADSVYYWNVTCLDDAGNSNESETRMFIVDSLKPNVTINQPENKTYNKTTILINILARDDINVSTIWFYYDYNGSYITIWNNKTGNLTYDKNLIFEEGSHQLAVYANDSAGNTGNDTINFIVNGSEPNVDLLSPNGGASSSSGAINFMFHVIDDFSKTLNCSLLINNVTKVWNETITNNTDTALTYSLSAGNYAWRIRCVDGAGNFNTSAERTLTLSSPGTSGGGGGGSSCSSECSLGQRQCINDSYYRVCGNYDEDLCLEWHIQYCEYGCSNGSCESCISNWSCGEWSNCINGTQTRQCEDLNGCNTNKPKTEKTCVEQQNKNANQNNQNPGITGQAVGGKGWRNIKPLLMGLGIIGFVIFILKFFLVRKMRVPTKEEIDALLSKTRLSTFNLGNAN